MGAAQVVLSSRDCGDTLVTGVCVCVCVCGGGVECDRKWWSKPYDYGEE